MRRACLPSFQGAWARRLRSCPGRVSGLSVYTASQGMLRGLPLVCEVLCPTRLLPRSVNEVVGSRGCPGACTLHGHALHSCLVIVAYSVHTQIAVEVSGLTVRARAGLQHPGAFMQKPSLTSQHTSMSLHIQSRSRKVQENEHEAAEGCKNITRGLLMPLHCGIRQ